MEIASGIVVESRVDTGRGVVATLLVSRGNLKVGEIKKLEDLIN